MENGETPFGEKKAKACIPFCQSVSGETTQDYELPHDSAIESNPIPSFFRQGLPLLPPGGGSGAGNPRNRACSQNSKQTSGSRRFGTGAAPDTPRGLIATLPRPILRGTHPLDAARNHVHPT